MKAWIKQLSAILAVVLVFAGLNGALYLLLTRRLGNNFSGTDQTKQVDVSAFLPHEEGSDLPTVKSSLTFSAEDDLPILDGAAALLPVYAAIIHNVYPEGSVTYEGGTFSDDNYYGENFAEGSAMRYRNTVRGYTAVVDGDCDILFCAAPSAEQKAYAEEQGVELVYLPIGREAFVFFVHQDNPVNDLTVDRVRDIYGGTIRNWAEVGGTYRPINPITRLKGSGSQSMMDIFMGDREIATKSPLAFVGGSIGFSFRYYMADMVANSSVKMLSLDGVYPSPENIRNGSYPVVAQFYAIYRADNDNPNLPILLDWILSPEGQQIIEEVGYVSIQ